MKKLFTLFLALVASVGTMSASSGTCGDNLTWDLTDGVLTISGSGDMYDYYYYESDIPWSFNRSSITDVSIGDGVTSIGACAFANCDNLTSIVISSSVIKIGWYAFLNCNHLSAVHITNIAAWCAIKGRSSLSNNPLYYAHNLYLNGTLVTDLVLPNSVTSIESGAFSGCTGLTSITIPNSVTSIGDEAFQNCSSLISVTIPNSVTSIGYSAFSGCFGLTSVTIPNSVTSVGEGAFRDCSSLSKIEYPSSVTQLGFATLYGCTGLVSIKIAANIPAVVEDTKYEGIIGTYYSNKDDDGYSYTFPNLVEVEVPAWFLDIREVFWPRCPKNLQKVVVNNGELTDNVLNVIRRSKKALSVLDVSNTENTTLPDEAFMECYNLQTLLLPSNLSRISYMAVAECVNLQSIDIPASVEEIDQRAFENCRSLQTITFGGKQPAAISGKFFAPAAETSRLKRIGNWAFYNAHELQHLEIPESVEEIGDAAFYGCTYLEDLSLPASVQSIGDNCFALCSKLTKIVVNSTTPPTIQAKTFYDVKRQIPVYVPDDCVEAYKANQYWGEFDIQGKSNMPHAIDNVETSTKASKILHNGRILILRGDKTYTLQGQEVK